MFTCTVTLLSQCPRLRISTSLINFVSHAQISVLSKTTRVALSLGHVEIIVILCVCSLYMCVRICVCVCVCMTYIMCVHIRACVCVFVLVCTNMIILHACRWEGVA